MSGKKGTRSERELVNALGDEGFGVMRAPASGSATTDALPDILAARPHRNGTNHYTATVFAIEAKRGDADPLYLDRQEAAGLVHFCRVFGAVPVVTGRWDRDTTHYAVHLAEAYRVPNSLNVRVHPDECDEDHYLPHEDLGGTTLYAPEVHECWLCGDYSVRAVFTDERAVKLGVGAVCAGCFEEHEHLLEGGDE